MRGTNFSITTLGKADLPAAADLIARVFGEFVAPGYSREGRAEFLAFAAPAALADKLDRGEFFFWGARAGQGELIGVLAGQRPDHVALLFVDKAWHKQGVAGKLFAEMREHFQLGWGCREFTVNASPYAVEAYARLGFSCDGGAREIRGIRFIPMRGRFPPGNPSAGQP